MKIINWNISYFNEIDNKISFLKSIVNQGIAILVLQEVTEKAYKRLLSEFSDEFNVEYSLNYRKPSKFDTKARKLGIAILTSKIIHINEVYTLERTIFPDRTLLVDVTYENQRLKIMGLHSITGCDYFKAKSVQFYSFAEAIDVHKPDIVAIDANEPQVDHYDVNEMVFFDNKDKGKGASTFFKTMIENDLVDSYVLQYDYKKYQNMCLTTSYIINKRFNKRYDFVFINKNVFTKYKTEYRYEEAIEAGSDHALVQVNVPEF